MATPGRRLRVLGLGPSDSGETNLARAPNPAGQAILQRFFPDGVSPLNLLPGALAPTTIVSAAFLLW